MKQQALTLVALLLACCLSAAPARAAEMRVIVVQTDNLEGYLKEVSHGQAILQRLDASATLRVWRARFAGPNAGTVVVTIEYADLTTYAADDKKTSADAEFKTWIKGLDKYRKITSDSLYDELKP